MQTAFGWMANLGQFLHQSKPSAGLSLSRKCGTNLLLSGAVFVHNTSLLLLSFAIKDIKRETDVQIMSQDAGDP